MKSRFLVPLMHALAGAAISVQAAAASFSGPMETTQWRVDASVFACKLYQQVPLLGQAVFLHRAGEQQRFYLSEINRQLAPGEARLYALTPSWRAFGQHQELGSVTIEEGDEPIRLGWRDSQPLMAQLHEGHQLLLRGDAWYEGESGVDVVIEPIRFRQALGEFQDCLGKLLPVNYDQIRRSSVHFPGGTEEFDDAERERLDNLARYVLADPYVTALVVDGHTDGTGLRAENLELSKRRAEFVVAYLVERGVPEDLVQVRWHGERYPVASNRTVAGRAENRRVTVRVDRFEPDPDAIARAD